jgi:hypothetical protein
MLENTSFVFSSAIEAASNMTTFPDYYLSPTGLIGDLGS